MNISKAAVEIINNEIHKTCSICNVMKPLTAYTKKVNGFMACDSQCIPCRVEYQRQRRKDSPDTEWSAQLKYKYDITIEDYRKLYAEQEGKCKICGIECESFDVDHDHKTGRVRGLLCKPCNKGIGQFKDDPLLVLKAADYLLDTFKKDS